MLRIVIPLAVLAFTVYGVVNVLRTPSEVVGSALKMLWLLIVVFVPVLGPLAWLLFGRPAKEGSLFAAPRRAPTPPDEDPEFLARLEDEVRRRKRTEELRRSGGIDPELRRDLDAEIERLEDELRQTDTDDEND